jgi:hypothetical protein
MPQDSLTLEFQKQLRAMRKTSGITNITPMPPTSQPQPQRAGGKTLADIAGFGDYNQQPDESGNLLTAAAKGVWQFAETATFGVPRLLYTEEFKKMLEPKGFAERVGAGIGGAAGFLLPMKWIGSGINLAVKGFAKGGVKKFSQRFVDDSIKVMEKDKAFMDFVNKKVTRGEIQEGGIREFMEGMLQEPRNKLLSLGTKEGEAIFARTVKDRMNFAKNFREQTPKILHEKLTEAGFGAKGVTNIVNTLGDDIAQKIGTVGAKQFKFPMTRLNQVIAGWTGNGKIGNLAAHALEEAALFSAVETPMNFIHSLAEEDVDFNLGSTLGHAFVLGSALGLIRMVPGGRDQPLLRTGFSRITNTFKNRRRYRNYNLEPNKARGIGSEIALADRAKFKLEVKNVFEAEPHIFKNARKLIKADPKRNIFKDYKTKIDNLDDIDNLMNSVDGRAQLKRIMGDVEKAFFDSWYPDFLRKIPGDLYGSSGRMLLGAMAFNFETYQAWMDGDMPLEDTIFHTALGMFLTKRGKKLEYTDSSTGKLETLHKDRPLIYGESFERADKYLRMLGSNLDTGLFRALYNEKIALKNGFESTDTNTADMQKLRKIAEDNGIIVEKYGSETTEDGAPIERTKTAAKYKIKGKDGKEVEKEQEVSFDDEVYSTFSELVRRNFVPKMTESDFDVLEGYEVKPKVLEKIKKQLSKEKFDSLLEYSNANKRGVSSADDLVDIVLGSGEATAVAYRDLVQRFIVDMHNTINKENYGDAWNTTEEFKFKDIDFSQENTKLVLRPIKISGALDTPSHEHSLAMLAENSNISKLLRPYIEYWGDPIEFTQEMSNKIFGKWKAGDRVEGKEALLDKYESELHELIFKDDVNATPRERRLLIGDPLIQNWTTTVLNRRTVRDHWRQIQSLGPNASNLGKFNSAEYNKAKKLITEIFHDGGYLASRMELRRGTDVLDRTSSKNESDYSFVDSFRQILSHDIKIKREQNYGNFETLKEAQISKVKELRKIIEDKIPILTMNASSAKSELIQEISAYATNQSLLGLRKANGKTLDYIDRAKIKLLQEAQMLTPSMEMFNVKGLIDNFELLFNRFKEISPDVAKNLDNTTAFLRHLSTKENAMTNLVSEVNDFKLYTELSLAAKELNISPAEFSERLLTGFNKHLSQYIRGTDGNGFITVGQQSAKVSSEFLGKLVQKLDLLDFDISRVTHDQLLKDIQKTIGKTFTNDIQVNNKISGILKQVMDISMLNPSRASVAQQILAKSGLYRPQERLWTWDELSKQKPETIDATLRNIEAELNYQFLQNNSFRDLELIHENDRFQNESKYPIEKPIIANIDQFIRKYKITSLQSGASGQSVGKILKGQTDLLTKDAYNFYDVMKKGASLTHKGKKFTAESWDNRALDEAHYNFFLESVNVYNQLRNSKTRRVITATKGESNPRFTEYTFQDNHVFKALEKFITELTFIDLDNFKVKEAGRVMPYDIRREGTPAKFVSEFYEIIGNKMPIQRKGGLGGQQAIEDALSPEMKNGYIIARLGTLGKGVGIPVGDITSTTGRITNPMNNISKEFISLYKQRKSELPIELVEKIDSFIERKLIDRNKVDEADAINLDSDGWEYKRIGENLVGVGNDFTMMLTNIVGNKVMGNEYWKVVKGDNWADSEALAKKPLRYMKLLFNGSARNIDTKISGELASALKRPELDFIPESIRGKDSPILKNLERFAKDPKKGGGTKWHYIGDEAILDGGKIPGVSSLFQKLKAQIDAENKAAKIDLNDMITEDAFPGGIPDASMFDSIQIVSKDYMDTIKFIKSINDPGIETVKPIGALASSTDAVWLDKTVWITDAAWEPYLKRHGIDGVKMGSSVKMAGEGLIGKTNEVSGRSEKAIYLDDYNTIEQVLNEKSDLSSKVITLPIDTYSISSVMKADKSATMPLQISAELTTPALNQSYFNWVMVDRLRDFITDADITYGSGNINDIASKLRFEDMEASVDQLGLMQKWIGKGLDPTIIFFKRQVRNALKRQFLDNRGVFTPKNIHGTQSNMVPTFASYGTKEFLRFSTFRNEGTSEVPNRKQWTYGEIEIDILNRGKKVKVDRIHFIEHNEAAKDNILGKTEIGSKSIEKLLDGKKVVNLGEVHDALVEYNKTLTGKTYQVAIIAHRTPTTRVSDKVVVALKGFDLTGNSVKINHADAWIRLEADHDMDKLNYWWDTPKDILNHWDSLGGKVDSINGIQTRKTIEGLNIADGASLVRYNNSDKDSQFYRGAVVKSRRWVQFLKSYQNSANPKVQGFSVNTGEYSRIRIADSDIVDRVEKQIAEDIQRIVDAQGRGYDNTIFNKFWSNRILFGIKGDDKYPGLMQKEIYNPKTKEYEVTGETLSVKEQDIVNAVIRPYKRLLQLQTSVFENGESKKVDYDSLIDYVQIYKNQMNNLTKSVYYNLKNGRTDSGNKYEAEDIDAIFKKNKEFINPFNLDDAKFAEPVTGTDVLFQNSNMLATDRMMSVIGGSDRLRMPKIEYKNLTETDNVLMDYLSGNIKDVSNATKTLLEGFKTDAQKIQSLNSIDYRIRRYRNSAGSFRRQGDGDMSSYWTRRADQLVSLRDRVNSQIMSDPKTQSFVRKRVRQQIRTQLVSGKKWQDYKGKTHDLSNIKPFQRNKIVNSKYMRDLIERSVWDSKSQKLLVEIRGINSDDYLQTLAIYNVMSNISGSGLNPATVGKEMSRQWETDRLQFRINYGKQWSDFRNGKLDIAKDANDIMNDALNELTGKYYEWNQVSSGLGQQFIFSVMTPEMSPYIVTYHKGHLMPGFKQTYTQGKFMTLGLRFFNRIDSAVADQVIDVIGRPISNEIAFFRGKNSDIVLSENAITSANIRKRTPVDFESEGGSPLIDYSNSKEGKLKVDQIHDYLINDNKPLDNEALNFYNTNERVLKTVGLTGDIALDYINYKAPSLGMELLGDLRLVADMDFIPSNALTRSGHIVPIRNYNDFIRHKKNQVAMLFGETSNKNIFTGKRDVIAPEAYGTPDNSFASKDYLKRTADRFLNEKGC